MVEDDDLDYLVVKGTLHAMPGWACEVHRAESVPGALAQLDSTAFDLCLCDYQLGSHLGTDLIRSARQRGVRIPILLLTGYDERAVDLEAMSAGADDFLAKDDVDPRRLERAIRYALGHRADKARLSRLAEQDGLTGLLNRLGFERRLRADLSPTGALPSDTGVVFVDLNRFKQVNDHYGHLAGDCLLQGVAARMQAVLEPGEAAARLGGDEFAVLTRRAPAATIVQRLARRLEAAFAMPFDLGEYGMVEASASIGAAVAGADVDTPEALLELADREMYRAKGLRPAEPEEVA